MGILFLLAVFGGCFALAAFIINYSVDRVLEEHNKETKLILKEEYIRRKLRNKREGY